MSRTIADDLQNAHAAVSAQVEHVTQMLAQAREAERVEPGNEQAAARVDAMERRLIRTVRALNQAEAARERQAAAARRAQAEKEAARRREATRALKLSRSRNPGDRAEFALGLLNELPPELAAAVLERARQRLDKKRPSAGPEEG